jgi:hypothetical protein
MMAGSEARPSGKELSYKNALTEVKIASVLSGHICRDDHLEGGHMGPPLQKKRFIFVGMGGTGHEQSH